MSEPIKKMCYDKLLPWELRNPSPSHTMVGPDGKVRAIMPIGKRWPNGTKLSIRFLGGTNAQQEEVARVADEWTKHANLQFAFDESPDAQIRISFENDGAWSYLGTDNLDIPRHAATMNFGFMGEGTILHEFGHAIGLAHEHQNPAGGIQWDEQAVIADLSGPPNSWSVSQIRHNVLDKYRHDQVNGTGFDPDSIMLYFFPADWTLNGVGTQSNDVLSATDKAFISSVYPKPAEPDVPNVVDLPVNEFVTKAASIGQPGEEDLFAFKVERTGVFVIETTGSTDVLMKLFGPDNGTLLVAEDDDSGKRRNARISAELDPGRYLVQVRHYNQSRGTGDYSVSVSRK